jgi:hypothetical protein
MSSQPPKDFLALSHGHEWVNFYESFDKLVQDHLSRSSELLRKAMSLPEVADREVAQIRDDLEGQLATERQQHQATLFSLKQEITNSQQQMSSLTQMFGSLMSNMERLTSSVDAALSQAAETEAMARAAADHRVHTGELDAPVAQGAAVESAGQSAVVESREDIAPHTDENAATWSELAAEAEGEPDDEIDLSALAAMEQGEPEAAESVEVGTSNGTERVRPHWLSMARSGSDQ